MQIIRPPLWIREKLTLIGREPLWQFLLLGALLWGASHYFIARDDRYVIRLGTVQRQRLTADYLREFGQPPSSEQLRQLIDRYIRDEIYWREGMALNLDRGDEIVRRRIIQKFEFLETDLAIPDSPAPAELERWFERNRTRYAKPERVAFSQIYFSADRGGDAAARGRALAILQKIRSLHTPRAPDLGDAFPGPTDVGTLTSEEAARLFGESDFSAQLFQVPVGAWEGPFRSGYGWHLVNVTARVPSALPSLTEVHDQVLADFLEEQRRFLNTRNFDVLRAKYRIVSEGGQ